ncbi:MAG: hypothetical protein EOO77_01055 [Oxalobacteraceae bacterium]|nr:MAG: hypothetical protein EOO77_01055 [Oxalobacteraceae bacterium]
MASFDTNSFTPAERDFIRREFCTHFSSYPTLADGIFLRTWRAGPQKGQLKIPKAMAGLVERSLVSLPSEPQSSFGRRAYFTEAGVAALRELLQDRRSMNPQRFAHLRQELGLDPAAAALVE